MEAADVMTWLVPIGVAAITGGLSYLGVYKSVKASHDQMISDLKSSQEQLALKTELQFKNIQDDIKRLEDKQDKHNKVIERTYKLEQKVEDLEKRIK